MRASPPCWSPHCPAPASRTSSGPRSTSTPSWRPSADPAAAPRPSTTTTSSGSASPTRPCVTRSTAPTSTPSSSPADSGPCRPTPPGPYPQGEAALRNPLRTELDQQINNFADTIAQLKALQQRFAHPGRLLVADTSFYIEHHTKLADTVLADALHERDTPLHLIVPIAVIDELDALKQASKQHVRWRARHTLAVLDAALPHGAGRGQLRPADWTVVDNGAIPRGEVTVEILFDPPGHHRLPINDDEIIDRAIAVRTLAGRPVTLITYDTGHSTRARAAGLDARKLKTSTDEPAPA